MIYLFKAIHYCLLMHLKTLNNMCLKIYELDYARFFTAPVLSCQAALKTPK